MAKKTVTQFNIFGEPETSVVKKLRKKPQMSDYERQERTEKKKAEKDKAWEEKWAQKGVKQGDLFEERISKVVSQVINEAVNAMCYDEDRISEEQAADESAILATFLIDDNVLVLKPTAEVVDDNTGEWCGIEIKPKFVTGSGEGFVIDDLTWEYDEAEPEMRTSPELGQMIDNVVNDKYDEICKKIYNNSPYT